ncbi:transcriptional regulator [Amycolatopsis sp. cg13]|uniref:transcriptional regulator n=1 Tax=Amycolatopsis sp. cg13 TaxID=3238807 RepID=UPI0035255628
MTRFVSVKGFTEGIDPILVPPVRLLIAVILADQRWHEYAALRLRLTLEPAVLSKQLANLRTAGYVDTRSATDGRRSEWRISDRGIDQLSTHLSGLHRLTVTASKALADARASAGESHGVRGAPRQDQAAETP